MVKEIEKKPNYFGSGAKETTHSPLLMAGFDAPLVEYEGDELRSDAVRRKGPNDYIREQKMLVEFIRNFRRGHEAYYRFVAHIDVHTAFLVRC